MCGSMRTIRRKENGEVRDADSAISGLAERCDCDCVPCGAGDGEQGSCGAYGFGVGDDSCFAGKGLGADYRYCGDASVADGIEGGESAASAEWCDVLG